MPESNFLRLVKNLHFTQVLWAGVLSDNALFSATDRALQEVDGFYRVWHSREIVLIDVITIVIGLASPTRLLMASSLVGIVDSFVPVTSTRCPR